jgi:glycosyltransferase involved in cell wall biosynthesis
MSPPPFFSIVIPLYNKEPYVEKTLDSVLAQQFGDYEIVVVNDGSQDEGPARVRAYAEKDPRVRLIDQVNGGVSRARNCGIAEARGRYVAFLDADDWWEPNHLSELKALADAFPQAGLLGTAYVRRYAQPPHLAGIVKALRGKRGLIDDYFKLAAQYQFIYTSSIAIPMDILKQQAIHFPPGVTNGEDLDLWIRLAIEHPVAYSGTVTVNYNCAVANSATRLPALTRHTPSLFPAKTLSDLMLSIDKNHPLRRTVHAYAEEILFARTLSVCLHFTADHREYMMHLMAASWSRAFKNKLLLKVSNRCFWKVMAQLRRLYRNPRISMLHQNEIYYEYV